MNIFAYTENEQRPGYVSLNRNNFDAPILSVRARGSDHVSAVVMKRAELQKLADSIVDFLERTAGE